VSVGATFYALPWLGIFAKGHFGRTDFSFKYKLSKGFDPKSDLANEDGPIEAGLRAGIVTWKALTLDIFAGYEITPYRPNFRINSAKLNTPFGPYDCTEFCRRHADFRYNPSQLNADATLHVRLWRFVPRLGPQYQRLAAVFDPRLDQEATDTIGLSGSEPEKAGAELSGIKHIPAVSPGLTVELPYGLALDAEMTFVPTEISNFMTVRTGAAWSY